MPDVEGADSFSHLVYLKFSPSDKITPPVQLGQGLSPAKSVTSRMEFVGVLVVKCYANCGA